MERLGSLTIPDHGLNTDDIKYFRIDSVIRGRGPNRLKYLDVEGRWVLNGRSIPYISSAFNHLERLGDAQLAFRDIKEEPLNAIGMVGWSPSSEPAKRPEKKTPPAKFVKPVVPIVEEVPPSPREVMPHRSAGYGPAHQKRKLSIPDRSRSPTPQRAEIPLIVDFDKYSKYERKDSITSHGTRWGAPGDAGYASEEISPRPSSEEPTAYWESQRPPHRTQALSPQTTSTRPRFDSEYSDAVLSADRRYYDELKVQTKRDPNSPVPYRTQGYGDYHVRRQYELSPRSTGSTDISSGSEQNSPSGGGDSEAKVTRNADEVLVMAYHMAKGKRASDTPAIHRGDWVRH